MKAQIKTLDNKSAGELTLDDAIFGVDVNQSLLHDMVTYQLAKRQAGTHKTKTRAEVRATGKKPWRQKGTGRARAGSLVRPIDVGGGVAHGPSSRSHAIKMPRKKRNQALRAALSIKVKEGKLVIIDDASAKSHKTGPMAQTLEKLGLTDSALIVSGQEIDPNFARATRNLPRIDVLPSQGANVYDILRRDVLVLTKQAVNDLTEKLKG